MKASTTKSKGFLVYLNECAREHLENNQPSTVITLDNIETVLKNVSNNDSDEDSDVDAINTKAKKMARQVTSKMLLNRAKEIVNTSKAVLKNIAADLWNSSRVNI